MGVESDGEAEAILSGQGPLQAIGQDPPQAIGEGPLRAISTFETNHPEAAALLRSLLRPGEKVRLITSGWRSWFLDDVFAGVPTLLGNRTLIVGTDQRLLLIHTALRGLRPQGYLYEVPRECVLGSLRTPLLSVFTTGGTLRFVGVPFAGKRSLELPLDGRAPGRGGPRMLCPSCFAPHAQRPESCPACGAGFKSPVGAGMRNLLLPGWGDGWLGSPWVGLATAAGVGFLWFNVFAFARAAWIAGPGPGPALSTMLSTFIGLAGGAHLLAAVVAWARGRRALIAEDGALGGKAGG